MILRASVKRELVSLSRFKISRDCDTVFVTGFHQGHHFMAKISLLEICELVPKAVKNKTKRTKMGPVTVVVVVKRSGRK